MERICYSAGKWVDEGEPFDVTSPAGETAVGRALRPSPQICERSIDAARGAAEAMKRLPSWKKADILEHIARRLEERASEFAESISRESGKPLRYSTGEAGRAVATFREASQECSRIYGEVQPLDATPAGEGRTGIIEHFPVGPVLAITPFNFPLNLVAHKVAPALAAGCPVIVKPASTTPLTALLLAEVIDEAGLPEGALSVLPATGAQAGEMAEDPRIRKVTFTGSAEVGWDLKQRCHTKKVTLELGGNAAVVVDEGWNDIEKALKRIITGGYAYSGQVCISIQRIFLHTSLYERFVESFIEGVAALRKGDILSEKTDIGPMIDEKEAARVEAWVGEAAAGGADILLGGKREGSFYQPTIIAGARPGMKVMDEEIFGPVTVVIPFDDYDSCLEAVNDSRFGLQAGIFTKDIDKIRKAFSRLEVGGVIAGDYPTFRVDRMPYGGVKASGFGREGLRWAIRDMCEPRLLVLA